MSLRGKLPGRPCRRAGVKRIRRAPSKPQRDKAQRQRRRAGGRREARVPRAAESGTRRHGEKQKEPAQDRQGELDPLDGVLRAGREGKPAAGGAGSPLAAPGLHDAAPGFVRVRLFEPQSLLRPVFFQVGELLAVDGSTPLPGETGQGCSQAGWCSTTQLQGGPPPWLFPLLASPLPYLLSLLMVLSSPCYHLLQHPHGTHPPKAPSFTRYHPTPRPRAPTGTQGRAWASRSPGGREEQGDLR